MTKEELKPGDNVLMRRRFSTNYFHGFIMATKRGLFGKKYLIQWTVNSSVLGEYQTSALVSKRRIIGKVQ